MSIPYIMISDLGHISFHNVAKHALDYSVTNADARLVESTQTQSYLQAYIDKKHCSLANIINVS